MLINHPHFCLLQQKCFSWWCAFINPQQRPVCQFPLRIWCRLMLMLDQVTLESDTGEWHWRVTLESDRTPENTLESTQESTAESTQRALLKRTCRSAPTSLGRAKVMFFVWVALSCGVGLDRPFLFCVSGNLTDEVERVGIKIPTVKIPMIIIPTKLVFW